MSRRRPVRGLAAPCQSASSLARAAREYIWLYDLRHGASAPEIAKRAGLSIGAVRAGLKRARAIDGRAIGPAPALEGDPPPDMGYGLVPLFPIAAFIPGSPCPHSGARPPRPFCCMVCSASYKDAP